MDQMGEVDYAPGEPQGHAVAPAPGLRDRDLHDRRRPSSTRTRHGGGGLITNGDTQWMTAGGGILHIETPARGPRRSAAACSTASSCGSNLPAADKMIDPRYQDLRGERRRAAGVGRRRRARAGDRRRRRRPRRPGRHPHPDHDAPRHRRPGAQLAPAVAPGLQRPRLRPGRQRHGRRRAAADRARASWPSSAPATCSPSVAPTPAGQPHAGASTSSSSAVSRSVSRWPPTARSS